MPKLGILQRASVVDLVLKIPDDVLDAVRLPPQEIEPEFRKELALALYQRGALSLGKARSLAQMTRTVVAQRQANLPKP